MKRPATKVNETETAHGSLLDERGSILEVASNVAGEAIALFLAEDLTIKDADLWEEGQSNKKEQPSGASNLSSCSHQQNYTCNRKRLSIVLT